MNAKWALVPAIQPDTVGCHAFRETQYYFVVVYPRIAYSGMIDVQFNPLHPNMSMHILHTVLYMFPNLQTRRTCLTIKSFFSW